MATKKAANGSSAKSEGGPKYQDAPPAGFRRRVSVSDAPWVEASKGNVCYGKLLNRFPIQNQDPPRHYYQIELLEPCKVRIGRGDDATQETAEAGEVVNLNEQFKLASLKEQEIPEIIAGAEYIIWAKYDDKIKIGGGKTMWNVDMHTKQIKPPTSQVRPLMDDAPSSDEAEADVPF